MKANKKDFIRIAKKEIIDYEKRNDITVCVEKETDGENIRLTIQFARSGIYRSRPALSATVEAAVNSIWNDAYHSLFGEEAADYIPFALIETATETGFRCLGGGCRAARLGCSAGCPAGSERSQKAAQCNNVGGVSCASFCSRTAFKGGEQE